MLDFHLELIQPDRLDQPLVVFGTGAAGVAVIHLLQEKWKITPRYATDNNETRWGSEISGISIHSPQRLMNDPCSPRVLIASMYGESIGQQLENMGLKYGIDWWDLFRRPSVEDDAETVFSSIYRSNRWGSDESVSGTGSTLDETRKLIEELPSLLAEYRIFSVLDAPCGDLNWMRHLLPEIQEYHGMDIVEDLIDQMKIRYPGKNVNFYHGDIVKDPIPQVDLIFCRDALVHLPHAQIIAALENFQRSRSTWLLTTHFPNVIKNIDIPVGEWRAINLNAPPFNLPEPVALVSEGGLELSGEFTDKSLGLWRLSDLETVRR